MKYIDHATAVFNLEIDGLKQVRDQLDDSFEQIIERIVQGKGRLVVTGMGKSGLVGKKISATLASTGTRSFFMHPGEAYHGDLGMIHSKDIVLAISNSGETEEVIKLIPFFKENGNTVIAVAGNPKSTLAVHSEFFLDISIPKEACPLELAPTTSTTVTMALGDALAVALMKARNFKEENFAKFHPGGSLGRKLLTKVSDIMKDSDLPILNKTSHFEDILTVISHGRLGVGVILENEKVLGVISDGDIRRVLKEKKGAALELTAEDFGLKEPVSISPQTKIFEAETLMQEKKITTLIVVDEGKFKGILHRYDI